MTAQSAQPANATDQCPQMDPIKTSGGRLTACLNSHPAPLGVLGWHAIVPRPELGANEMALRPARR